MITIRDHRGTILVLRTASLLTCVFCSKIFWFWQFGFLPLCCCLTVMTQCYHCCACFGWIGLFKRRFWVLKVEMPKSFSWTPVVAKKPFQSYRRLWQTPLIIIKLCVYKIFNIFNGSVDIFIIYYHGLNLFFSSEEIIRECYWMANKLRTCCVGSSNLF